MVKYNEKSLLKRKDCTYIMDRTIMEIGEKMEELGALLGE